MRGNPTMGAIIAAMMFLIILSGVPVYLFFSRQLIRGITAGAIK